MGKPLDYRAGFGVRLPNVGSYALAPLFVVGVRWRSRLAYGIYSTNEGSILGALWPMLGAWGPRSYALGPKPGSSKAPLRPNRLFR